MALSDDIKDLIEHETTEAQHLLRGLAQALPKSAEAHLLLATSHLRRLEFDIAIPSYRDVLALDPKNNDALNNLGFCLMAKGDYAESLEAFRHAFKMISGASALRCMALLSHRLGRLDEAIAQYSAAIKVQPRAAPALYGRGLAELKKGAKAEGEADIAAAKAIAPGLPQQYQRYGLAPDGAPPGPGKF